MVKFPFPPGSRVLLLRGGTRVAGRVCSQTPLGVGVSVGAHMCVRACILFFSYFSPFGTRALDPSDASLNGVLGELADLSRHPFSRLSTFSLGTFTPVSRGRRLDYTSAELSAG